MENFGLDLIPNTALLSSIIFQTSLDSICIIPWLTL